MIRIDLALFLLQASQAATTEGVLRDRRGLEEFVDSTVSEQMERHRLPGVVVAIVEGDEVLLVKGYGLADMERKTPVSADETLFSLASVTKVLTAAAVMKVVESGQLRMDEDVNRYLTRFQLKGKPVTLTHLLTHTAGFDTYPTSIYPPEGEPPPSLSAYLSSQEPPRLEEPGELVSYSNYGIALAGGIVEETTGVPYARFVEDEIFQPLGMTRSFVGVPSEAPFPLAKGYVFRDGSHHDVGAGSREQILLPAAGLVSTGSDMAQFMLGLLRERPGFLNESTLREMYERRFSFHPRANGVTYGLREHFENRIRALMQDGDWEGFSSRLALIPEKGVGFFVAYNTSSAEARASMLSSFLDRYYPETQGERIRAHDRDREPLERFEGVYYWRRFPELGVLKLVKLFGRVRVERTKNEELRILTSGRLPNLRLPELRFLPAGHLWFERVDGEGAIAFRENARGEITHLELDVPEIESTGSMLFQKTPWYGTPRVQIGMAGIVLPIVLSGIFWPVSYFVRRMRGQKLEHSPGEGRSRVLGGFVACSALLFLLALAPALRTVIVFGPHLFLRATLTIPLLIAVLAPGLCWFSVLSWRRGYGSLFSRLHYSLFTAATIALLAQLHYWNLVGFRY